MIGKETRHVQAFRSGKLRPGEEIVGVLSGWIGEMMGTGSKAQRNGTFVLTNLRACFYRKGFLGEVFETIPLAKITSVETLSRLGYRILRLHTSHDELAFKTFESKQLFDLVYDQLEAIRHPEPQLQATISQVVLPTETREECECPYCAELILRRAKVCKHCGRDIADAAGAKCNADVLPDASPIPISFACNCGATLRAKTHLAGKNVQCPKCKSQLRVPSI